MRICVCVWVFVKAGGLSAWMDRNALIDLACHLKVAKTTTTSTTTDDREANESVGRNCDENQKFSFLIAPMSTAAVSVDLWFKCARRFCQNSIGALV